MDSEGDRSSPDPAQTDDNASQPHKDKSSRPSAPSRASTFGPKCWICMSDKSEDDPDNPPIWRSPCSCSLTAHEACLLDWVADLENPKNKTKNSGHILCPQCKSEIRISRPRSYVVDSYRALDRTLGKLVLPGLGLSFVGTLWAGAWFHGFQSVYLVFGHDDASRVFRYAIQRNEFAWMYSLIPVNLILARTDYADFALPGSSLILLSTQITDKFDIDMTIWPPLPSTVFACLPAMRSVYNWCYYKAFSNLNHKWLAEVQPRQNEQGEGAGENGGNVNEDEMEEVVVDGDLVLQIDVNLNDEGEGEDGDDGQAAVAGNGGNVQGQPENHHVRRILGRHDLVDGSGSIGQTVLGALVFPAVAAGMGNLISCVLPSSWLTYRNYTNALIRFFLHHPTTLTPRPLRFSRNRYLRHWTIARAWNLYRHNLKKSRELELERQYNAMRDANEELRVGAGDGGRLFRKAQMKTGVWGIGGPATGTSGASGPGGRAKGGVPIEYARGLVEWVGSTGGLGAGGEEGAAEGGGMSASQQKVPQRDTNWV
ncbi:hypothetical protein AYL99_06673 [Fonsecaea erecta]|uniref:RING-CH-type domain-containing protein n=1 Tax=Fonsecaea erecta TaxID=1367422 RepID=A0A178ZK10_9EURO|nr:hypothetical protein AYL99_06673 [Fonsecaea erecta]OAP59375.1 hypothetical protein AYL99_06673 [Fonsecaea erecta]